MYRNEQMEEKLYILVH